MRAADLVIVPLPPSPLSARAFAAVVEEVRGSGKGHPPILPVLSMLDLRRTLHRDAREANPAWPAIPLASAVEQCAVERRTYRRFRAALSRSAGDCPTVDGDRAQTSRQSVYRTCRAIAAAVRAGMSGASFWRWPAERAPELLPAPFWHLQMTR